MSETEIRCSFCNKSQHEVRRLIAGPETHICDECVDLCNDIIEEETEGDAPPKDSALSKPHEIKEHLDQYIIGQDQAKRVLSVAVYNHYKRLEHKEAGGAVELSKSNVLLLGPTGTGKTLLAQTLARALNVPFTIADATTLTEAGYVGEDVETVVKKLLDAADGDVEKAQRGIVYIDEIDKITRKGENVSITRDVSGEGVQQALLKLIEGTVCSVSQSTDGRKVPGQAAISVDTSDILFIVGGAFAGLDQVVKTRSDDGGIGFGASVKSEDARGLTEILSQVQPADLIAYGLIPEFIGRLPIIASLEELTEESLIRILTEPKNAITKQFDTLLGFEGVQIEWHDSALTAIAEAALERKTGARGLRTILENVMLDTMFDLPRLENVKKIVIDGSVIRGEKSPLQLIDGELAS